MGTELLKFTRGNSGRGADGAGRDQGSDQVKRILAAYRKGDRETRTSIGTVAGTLVNKRTAELLELHRGLGAAPALMSVAESTALVHLTHYVSMLGELPQEDVELAERRLDALLRYHDIHRVAEAFAQVSVALLRLRRGQYADVERLCRSALAHKVLPPLSHEMTLAIVIVVRQALRMPYADVHAEAVALERDAGQAVARVRQISGVGDTKSVVADLKEFAANLKGPAQPERTNRLLAAYRDLDPVARAGVSLIGRMLRDEGRIAELLELHAGLPAPSGRWATELMHAMADLEDVVAGVPGLPVDAYELAATRVQWLFDNYPYDGKEGARRQAASRHTLAVVRLRQGRFDEVEPLCADSMADTSISVGDRAQVLATIALARRGQGQPYEDLLTEAVSLSPDEYLVKQAVAATAAGQSS
jgi:hypothetical protein